MRPGAVVMGQAICRCGQPLEVPPGEVVHVVCPTCAAKVRIVRKPKLGTVAAGNPGSSGDGYIRFACPCGRKLKVSLLERPSHGKCPDCGRVVPVPADNMAQVPAEAPTADMPAVDEARLAAWAKKYAGSAGGDGQGNGSASQAGGSRLRICPKCGKPIHMGADACRTCGVVVPKR